MNTIYLDHQATTPVDPRVLEAMMPFFTDCFGNPHATTYVRALHARRAVEDARQDVAAAVGARARDLVFTSGATEANNLAVLGITAVQGSRRRVVTQATEHRSILDPIASLSEDGFEVITVGVDRDGIVDLAALRQAVNAGTLLVSIMLVNNETGVIQPIAEIAAMCQEAGALLHCDCAQALGRIPVNVKVLGVDLASFSAHKSYGPKGIGSLYVKNLRTAPIRPIYRGGGQEGGIRPGTLPVPLCVGFGVAARLAAREQAAFAARARRLQERLWTGIQEAVPRVRFNGHPENRAAGCLSICFPGARSDALIDALAGLDVSTGSACEATKTRVSHVLKAMRLSRAEADATIRMSIGRFTTDADVGQAIAVIKRQFKP